MPADRSAIEESGSSGTLAASLWALPVLLLVAVWLWLAFSSRGVAAEGWAFPAIACGIVGIGLGAFAAYPRRPRQLSLVFLTFVGAFAVWALASNIWTRSTDSTFPAGGRTFLYLLVLALALSFFTSGRARSAFKYLLMAGALALVVACIARLWTAAAPVSLFVGGRLAFPIGHANGAAALFLLPFWPLLWLAAGPEERAPVRGVAIGLATGLLGLAVMTQSRSAAWSIGITVVLLFLLSPGRVRLLFYVVIPGLLMVYAFPIIDVYRQQWPAIPGGGTAARTLTVAMLASGFIGLIVALLEKWIKVTSRMKAIFGFVVLAGCAAGLIYGAVTLTQDVGGPVAWFTDRWEELTGEPATDGAAGGATTASPGSAQPSIATRADLWDASWKDVQRGSLVGLGAGYTGTGATAAPATGAAQAGGATQPRAESLVLRVLAETGLVGGVLLFAGLLAGVAGIMWPRTAAGWRATKNWWRTWKDRGRRRASAGQAEGQTDGGADPYASTRWGRRPVEYGWEMALLTGAAYWFVQANLDGLWLMPGVTLPALLMLAASLAATDARARTMWPRVGRRLRRRPSAGARMTLYTSTGETAQAMAAAAPVAETMNTGTEPRRAARRRRRWSWPRWLRPRRLEPPGRLSAAFRYGLIAVSAVVVLLALSSYLLDLL